MAEHVPAGFAFPMRCVSSPDGLRRFYPSSVEGMIARGFEGGLAVLSVLFDLGPARRSSYRAMYLFFQRLRQTRERLRNELLSASSLAVARSARDLGKEEDILPASLGRDAQGEGKKWGVQRLLREGYELAVALGIDAPTEARCIEYGLLAAARRNPLHLKDEEVAPLVRMALYESIPWDGDGDEGTEPALFRFVVQRALTAVQQPAHLSQPADAFMAWFAGPKNSFVRQVASRRLRPGGVLDRALVRRALQDLGWRAYAYVAGCLHAQLWLFERLFPEPLGAGEARWFGQMHLPQPYLGNLPAALLSDRLPFLGGALWEVWESAGAPGPVAVLHRLLDYYAEMASARRATDRRVQQRRAGPRRPGGGIPSFVPLPTQPPTAAPEEAGGGDGDEGNARAGPEEDPFAPAATPDNATAEVFAALAELVRRRRQVNCTCATPAWDDRAVGEDEDGATIEHTCASCGFTAESTLTFGQLKALAEEALS
jgi:hypothetical protein